jgi:hypothetical protein
VRHVRMLGLCLVAILAVTALAATSASALPEWGRCEAKTGGKFSDANCTKKAALGKGTFEWKKGKELKPVHFSGGNVGSGGVLISKIRGCFNTEEKLAGRLTRAKCKEIGGREENFAEPIKIECESEHNVGETSGTNSVINIDVKFFGCKAFGTIACSNGPTEGEIDVNPLKGSLGYINKAEKKVGVLLEPVAKHGEFAKFSCAGGQIATVVGVGNSKEGSYYVPETTGGYDGIISPITPVNTMTSEFTQVYTVNPETAENIPSKFEGKHIELLEDYLYNPEFPAETEMWSRSGEEITNVNTPAEPGEIKA